MVVIVNMNIDQEYGSNARNNTPKCSLCNKRVGTTRKRLQYSKCRNLTHITCSNISKTEQKLCTAQTVFAWLCSDCTLSTLPFEALHFTSQ